jgi:hypothetical protein
MSACRPPGALLGQILRHIDRTGRDERERVEQPQLVGFRLG